MNYRPSRNWLALLLGLSLFAADALDAWAQAQGTRRTGTATGTGLVLSQTALDSIDANLIQIGHNVRIGANTAMRSVRVHSAGASCSGEAFQNASFQILIIE